MDKIELCPYIPKTGSYKIYYPKDFQLGEDEQGIVTITSQKTFSNLTVTGYQASNIVDEKVLIDFFQQMTTDYTRNSELHKSITRGKLFLECAFERNNIKWIWWGLAQENQIILISANYEEALSKEDYNLFRHMIEIMEIYPSKFEE